MLPRHISVVSLSRSLCSADSEILVPILACPPAPLAAPIPLAEAPTLLRPFEALFPIEGVIAVTAVDASDLRLTDELGSVVILLLEVDLLAEVVTVLRLGGGGGGGGLLLLSRVSRLSRLLAIGFISCRGTLLGVSIAVGCAAAVEDSSSSGSR